jgi:hypothetical protein
MLGCCGVKKTLLAGTFLCLPLTATAGTWQRLANSPNFPNIGTLSPGGAGTPILMTDGTVIMQNSGYGGADGTVFRLTPDRNGSYVHGTWSQIASLPYAPIGGAEAVLPDGRVIVEGGEYTGPGFNFLLTNQGAIYNPVTNAWTVVQPPKFFIDLYPPRRKFAPHPIGDSASVVLANGTFMLADKMSRQAALLNAKTLTWVQVGQTTKSDLNDEEGWTLLPNGQVLTVDCYTDYYFGLLKGYPANPTNSEIYNPATFKWSSAGSTINTLTDPSLSEMGAAILRPDGTVFATGSQGYTSIYNTKTATWSAGPRLPISPQGNQYTLQDAPGALLPNGNVLIAASGGAPNPNPGDYSNPPVAFFEFDGTKLIAEPTIPDAANDQSGSINMLVLPTGQILETDITGDIEIYTPTSLAHDAAWEPIIKSAPADVVPGHSYRISGIRFNGMSQGSAFGDEDQNATNYPLVRITNTQTQHVFYARTHDHSSMAVASPALVYTTMDIPATIEKGASTMVVVANGIASAAVDLDVK